MPCEFGKEKKKKKKKKKKGGKIFIGKEKGKKSFEIKRKTGKYMWYCPQISIDEPWGLPMPPN